MTRSNYSRNEPMHFPATTPRTGLNARPTLTLRETEVLSLIVQGRSSKEAADTLFLSKRTVDFHLTHIYAKLQVTNRVQAFREASRLGLIPTEPSFAHARGEA
jgi:DNA-binding CsgD family transcriptional regulator